MTIYKVSYIGADDNTYYAYYGSKAEAKKHHAKLRNIERKAAKQWKNKEFDPDEFEGIKQLFEIYDFECTISKKGILEMLNKRFNES